MRKYYPRTNLFRSAPSTASAPVPRKIKEEGSGVAAIGGGGALTISSTCKADSTVSSFPLAGVEISRDVRLVPFHELGRTIV